MSEDEVLSAPDPKRPDAFFRDGRDIYLVEVLPRRMPTFLTEQRNASAQGSLLFSLIQAIFGSILWSTDDGSKVVVRRRPGRALALFHTILKEEFPTEKSAEVRRIEILSNWNRRADPRRGE